MGNCYSDEHPPEGNVSAASESESDEEETETGSEEETLTVKDSDEPDTDGDGEDSESESSEYTVYEVIKATKVSIEKGVKIELKRGWELRVEREENNKIFISHENLDGQHWLSKQMVGKYLRRVERADMTPTNSVGRSTLADQTEDTTVDITASEAFFSESLKRDVDPDASPLEVAVRAARGKAEPPPPDSPIVDTLPDKIEVTKEDSVMKEELGKDALPVVMDAPTNAIPTMDEEKQMFMQLNGNIDKTFVHYLKNLEYTEKQIHQLQKLNITKSSWERMENGETLNDEIARALLQILAAKLQVMGSPIAGFEDPKFHGPRLPKRKGTKFHSNNTSATANIFNDGTDCYVCAIQQSDNTITYCNSKNPGERPPQYIIDQIRKAFDLKFWNGHIKIQSHHCQRQSHEKNDSLLWAIVNIYMIIKGSNVATNKLKEKNLRNDYFKKMLLTGRWVTLMKKNVEERGKVEEYFIKK